MGCRRLLIRCSKCSGRSQTLVGTWKGEIDLFQAKSGKYKEGPARVLIIQSVEQTGGKWVVMARYGYKETDASKVDVQLELGDTIKVKFETGAGSHVGLGVSDDLKSLTGLFIAVDGIPRKMTLRKVEP